MDKYECCSCDRGYTWYTVPHAINTSVSGDRIFHARSLLGGDVDSSMGMPCQPSTRLYTTPTTVPTRSGDCHAGVLWSRPMWWLMGTTFLNLCVIDTIVWVLSPGDDDGCPYSIPYFLFSVCWLWWLCSSDGMVCSMYYGRGRGRVMFCIVRYMFDDLIDKIVVATQQQMWVVWYMGACSRDEYTTMCMMVMWYGCGSTTYWYDEWMNEWQY